ncbi:hypothetical protein L249_7665 [Ophiocordyceps polyrhachis-furcata BCC 54312]|uniref:Uncharacterized protein n=1 Tax=Ophiocordyceps polyrhachis-furcata BCC 54312 TaxID=1330021 RepID=A0A367LAC3_9HYPO|nr:hypothetical protein L249_7665 [Ophiocordyceps polyrhachis-furcata BCC 54312]
MERVCLPNFPTAADGLRKAAEQLELCDHLPAVDNGVRMLQKMDAIMDRLDQLGQKVEALDQKVDALDRRVDALDRKVDALDRKVDALDRKLDQKVDALDQKFNALDQKVTTLNRNALVRQRNSHVIRGDMNLVPPYSVLTGEVIEDFPRNIDELGRLPVREIEKLLRSLGETVAGSAAEKKRSLSWACGLLSREF